MKRAFTLLILISTTFAAMAQNQYLLLYRAGKQQHSKYNVGESIRFKFTGDDEYSVGTITSISDSLIFFDTYAIRPDTIAVVDISRKPYHSSGIRDGAALLAVAGVGYVAIDWFNRVVVSKERGGLDKRILRTSGGFLAGSVLLSALRKKSFIINGKHRIIIINPNKIVVD